MASSISVMTLRVGSMETNCHIVYDSYSKEAIIIDPGDDAEYISDRLTQLALTPTRVVATHGHFDHIMAAFALTLGFSIPFGIHALDAFLVRRMRESAQHFLVLPHIDPPPAIGQTLSDGDTLPIGRTNIFVLHTPGHTPGSVCFYIPSESLICTGDTIFAEGAIGRTDRSYASSKDIQTSIRMILSLPKHTRLLSGHGNETTVGAEAAFHVQ